MLPRHCASLRNKLNIRCYGVDAAVVKCTIPLPAKLLAETWAFPPKSTTAARAERDREGLGAHKNDDGTLALT